MKIRLLHFTLCTLLAAACSPMFANTVQSPGTTPPAGLSPQATQAAEAESERYRQRRARLQQDDPAIKAAIENITIISMENQNRMDEAQIVAEELVLNRIEATEPELRGFVTEKRALVAQRRAAVTERTEAVRKLKAESKK